MTKGQLGHADCKTARWPAKDGTEGGAVAADRNRGEAVSPLRRARLARNWTLEDAVFAVDRATGGSSGATPSLLSAWERGKIRTSLRYRKVLCELYRLPAEVLFAHQEPDQARIGATVPESVLVLRVVRPHPELLAAMIDVVHGATRFLAVTGSRSREVAYLEAIELAVAEHPELVHYRVLFGPPRQQILTDHLGRLLALRDPADRSRGHKTMHIGMVDAAADSPERFFVASESEAVIVVPSLSGADPFDTGIVLGPDASAGLILHAREAYAGAKPVETAAALGALSVKHHRSAGGE
jgi:transcriptional regulator with XRE-family HTH domain